MTYAEIKEHENDEDTRVALLARIYNGEMPPLRIGDWLNALIGKTKTFNEIDLKKGIMTRRIKKNQKEDTEDIIPLPKSLVEFIKKRGIKGELFPSMSVTEIDNLLKKIYPGKVATPHYFRSLYSVKIAPTLSKAELKKALEIMDHSAKINAQYYKKEKGDPLLELLVKK